MKKTDCAYIAGIIDGEGHIGKSSLNKKKWGVSFRIAVGSTDFELLEWLLKTTKIGGIFVNSSSLNNPKWKKSWIWLLQDRRKISSFLKEIFPFLQIKRKIEISKKFIDEIDSYGSFCLHWTKKEDDFIRKNYIILSDSQLAEKLERGIIGVFKRRLELNCKKETKTKGIITSKDVKNYGNSTSA